MGSGASRVDEGALRRCLEPRTKVAPLLLKLSSTRPVYDLVYTFEEAQMLPRTKEDLCFAFDIPARLSSRPREEILFYCITHLLTNLATNTSHC